MKNFLLITLLFFSMTSFIDDENYFEYASSKIEKYNPTKKDYAIVVDYTKSILSKRLYVLDMNKNEVIMESTVSHAFKSGLLYPSDFSNVSGSNKSSKGVFVTAGTYNSQKWGYAMNIKGLDDGINNNALNRRIVFHSDKNMKTMWSLGCFATPEDVNKELIDLTKNGVLVCVITN